MHATKTRRDLSAWMDRLEDRERTERSRLFLAPRVAGGRVRTRLAGIVQAFAVEPASFQGWGIFAAAGATRARLVEEAAPAQIARYLGALPAVRLILARPLVESAWLAYPAGAGDFSQRVGPPRPVVVHLVDGGDAFETVVARAGDGALWFDAIDRRAPVEPALALRSAWADATEPDALRFSGLTPEMRAAYAVAASGDARFGRLADEARLRAALATGGGRLDGFAERGDYWVVEWRTGDGERHTSAIARADLSVVSSGICLSERDSDFDLTSLVGVIERRTENWE